MLWQLNVVSGMIVVALKYLQKIILKNFIFYLAWLTLKNTDQEELP